MITTYSNTSLESEPSFDIKAILAEPFLVVGSAAFWLITLPLAAVAVICVRGWDALSNLFSPRANPLILQRGGRENAAGDLMPSEPAQRRS
ncbi:MAG TPA: hypothetical protein VGG02_03600 [Chthoniobacterales bacterium]|jgi:hypothetical protein